MTKETISSSSGLAKLAEVRFSSGPVPLTSAVAAALAASFLFDVLAPALNLPESLRKISIFQLYGQPLIEGLRWVDLAVMLSLIVAFLAAGTLAFSRRDVLK